MDVWRSQAFLGITPKVVTLFFVVGKDASREERRESMMMMMMRERREDLAADGASLSLLTLHNRKIAREGCEEELG